MSRVIATAVIKGGTGKTTTAAALAQAAAAAGQKVLAIDLDPQSNLSFFLAADQNLPGTYQLLHGTPAADLVQHSPQGLDVISASPDLATEKTTPASAKRLQRAIEPLKKDYDWILVDTPPVMGELLFNALQAATGLLIPLEADSNSLEGFYQIVEIARQMQHSNPGLQILGAILTRFDARPKINRALQEAIATAGAEMEAPLLGAIRPGTAIKEAQALQANLFDHAPKSNPAQDYKKIFELIQEG